MPVIRPADAVFHDMHGSRFTSFVAPARGSSELCAWRLEVPGGLAGVAHTITREEVFLVTEGEPHLTIDGRTSVLHPGDAAVVPAGSVLRLDNPAAQSASAWVTTSIGLEAVLSDGSRLTPPWAC
ncbi:MAG: cupin domain-containing protein [Nocardiopsaceae bacterium]|nr:cupin domain-containing protein [Nocardiopsaceae bacterium]